MKTRQEVLAEVLEKAYNLMSVGNNNIELRAKDPTTEKIFYSISLQQMAQWDYSEEEWKDMDFYLLAEEVMENLGIKNK